MTWLFASPEKVGTTDDPDVKLVADKPVIVKLLPEATNLNVATVAPEEQEPRQDEF